MNTIVRQELKSKLTGTLISGSVTAVFMFLIYYKGWASIFAGLCIGATSYFGIATYIELIARKYLRKTNLILLLVLNSLANVLIIFISAWVFVGIFYLGGTFSILLENFSNLFSSYFLIGLLFGLFLSIVFTFYGIVGTLIGKNTLGKLFIGMYRTPVETDRVFMFLDIKSSTSIAEKTGHLKFLSLVNDFFYDIAEPVRKTKGEIYKYVGDEAIITWKTNHAITNANCIRCFYLIEDEIAKRSEDYLSKYGIVPEFKAGLHGGLSVTGELGYTRREIAYMGDVLNTTARIEEACKTYGRHLLISEHLVKQIVLPDGYKAVEVGMVRLRGKEKEMRLLAVERENKPPEH
jgi:adenylate cyclase